MPPQLISLKPKPPAESPVTPSTGTEATPTYPDKASFPTIDRKDDLPVKRKATPQPEDDDRSIKPTPRYNRREPTDTRRTQRGYSARQTPGRVRPPRVSRAFESKFHALEKRQRNLVQQTKQKGQPTPKPLKSNLERILGADLKLTFFVKNSFWPKLHN